MSLTNNEKKLFIFHTLLQYESGIEKLRDFLETDDFLNHSVIKEISDGELKIVPPTPAQQNFSLTDTAFQYFVEQKAADGYIYGSVKSFKLLVGLD